MSTSGKGLPITGIWTTNYRGTTFVLDHNGRLRATQRKDPMNTAHRMTILAASPGPVDVAWSRWRIPEAPETHKPVLRLSKGRVTLTIGPDDADNLIDALERMRDAWEGQ